MTVAPGFRAVVFALRDLPPSDQRYLTEVAHALGWLPAREAALWDTPLLLVRQSDTPPVPDLRSDDEVAASGPPLLLLAMRLVQADALQWPELRFLGLDLMREAPDYVLYAADPKRWTPGALADSLATGGSAKAQGATAVTGTSWHIQRGLQSRPPRLPPVPGDRVPVLGLQVPLFGGRLADLRDLRPFTERLRSPLKSAAAGNAGLATSSFRSALPLGSVAGHHQGRYALTLLINTIEPGRHADHEVAQVDLQLSRIDISTGATVRTALHLTVGELDVLHDAETTELTPGALSDWLAELLPSCFLVAPSGDVLLIDWFHLDLALRPETAAPAELTLRICSCPGRSEPLDADPDDSAEHDSSEAQTTGADEEPADPTTLDVAMWSLPVFAELLAAADLTLSESGRYLFIESAIPIDGELTHLSALLDTTATPGPHILRCTLSDSETPTPKLVTDDVFPALRGSQAAPGAIA